MSEPQVRIVSRFYREEEPLRRLVRELARAGGPAILDVGCRKGEVTRPLATGGRHVVGVDRVLYDEWRSPHEGFRFVAGDASMLPFRDDTFDVVVSSECLQYVPEWRRALGEFRRVLRPGGWLVLTCPNGTLPNRLADPYVVRDRLQRLRASGGPPTVVHRSAVTILEHCRGAWEIETVDRRGTTVYIWTAMVMEELEGLRLGWGRRSRLGRRIGDLLLGPLVVALGALMRADFTLRLGALSYNGIYRMRRPAAPAI